MDIEEIQMHLADATADLSFGRNKEKHFKIITYDLKQISDYLDANGYQTSIEPEHTYPMIVGYLLYRLKEGASS